MRVKDAAKRWNLSERRVRGLCANGQIEGAFQNGKTWVIPDSAKKPVKILYVSDYLFDEYNSVRDIVYNMVCSISSLKVEQVVVHSGGSIRYPTIEEEKFGFKSFFVKRCALKDILDDKDIKLKKKLKFLFCEAIYKVAQIVRLSGYIEMFFTTSWLKQIIKKESPSMVVFATLNTSKHWVKFLVKKKLPYVVMNYDTTVENPGVSMTEKRMAKEQYIIDNSVAFFVPNFFRKGYAKYFESDKIKSYKLPLLIDDKEVLAAYEEQKEEYKFSYFGQLQTFRKGNLVNGIFDLMGEKLQVFSTQKIDCGAALEWHPAVTKGELYKIVAGSKYLVALDNGAPYEHFLPSKAYLYLSFTKPIVAFGDNKTSALKEFFKDYPHFYYQNFNEPIDGLTRFLEKEWNGFDRELYSKYLEYSAEQALGPIIEIVKGVLKK